MPEPAERIRSDAVGTPVELADGRTWLLAEHPPELGGVWDTLYNDAVARGSYVEEQIRTAALHLLLANYDLSAEEAFALTLGAPIRPLVEAVEHALWGPGRITYDYSDWVLASLYANGIDPDRVPPAVLPTVLELLVAMKRTLPAEQMIGSLKYAKTMRAARSHAGKPS